LTPGQRNADPRFAQLPEADLIRLAKADAVGGAVDELLARHYATIRRFIAYRAFGAGLRRPDREDAEQEALCALLEAIRAYDPAQLGRPGGCSFCTFLRRVLGCRFADHLRRVRRARDRRRGTVSLEEVPAADPPSAAPVPAQPFPPSAWTNEPLVIVEWGERMAGLGQALSALDDDARWLWEQRGLGKTFAEIATELGISCDAAKRRWRKVVAHLKARLRAFRE
jgi:RNA polymerase sigma factor (sigma-70 family)